MTITVNVQDAKTRLSELLRAVERGEDVVIARAGTPIARVSSVAPRKRSFDAPALPGIAPIDAAVFLEPLSSEELAAWEASSATDPLSPASA